jgi:hypothetical protein
MCLWNGVENIAPKSSSGRSIGEDHIQKLLGELDPDLDYSIRRNAVEALGEAGDLRAMDALENLLADESEVFRLRWRAARALGDLGDQRALDTLTEVLDDVQPVVRWEAVIALGKIGGPAAIRSLQKALKDESHYVCKRAAQALIGLEGIPSKSLENLDYLLKLLSSGDEGVKENLIDIGENALPSLACGLDDPSFFVRRDIAETLALYIYRIIENRPEGADLFSWLATNDFPPERIGQLYDIRIAKENGLVKRVETTNFEKVSQRLRGNKSIELGCTRNSMKRPMKLHDPGTFAETDVMSIDLQNFLSERGIDELHLMGRTLIANGSGDFMAIKLGLRDGDEKKLLRESLVQSYLHHHCKEIELFSILPLPLAPVDNSSYLFKLSGIPSEIRNELRLSGDPYAICYTAENDYFAYLNDPELSTKSVGNGLAMCARDLARLTRSGIIHTSLIPLFHNREQTTTRADGGIYRWWAKIAGRLDRWRVSCQYPNLRLSGLADFEHMEFFRNLSSEELQHHIGDHLFSLSLVLGSYFRNRMEFDEVSMSRIMGDCFVAYLQELTCKNPVIDECIDWDLLAQRMKEEMEGDRYMMAIIRDGGPNGESIEVLNGPHLGLFNGFFPLPELIRAVYLSSLFAVQEM